MCVYVCMQGEQKLKQITDKQIKRKKANTYRNSLLKTFDDMTHIIHITLKTIKGSRLNIFYVCVCIQWYILLKKKHIICNITTVVVDVQK